MKNFFIRVGITSFIIFLAIVGIVAVDRYCVQTYYEIRGPYVIDMARVASRGNGYESAIIFLEYPESDGLTLILMSLFPSDELKKKIKGIKKGKEVMLKYQVTKYRFLLTFLPDHKKLKKIILLPDNKEYDFN